MGSRTGFSLSRASIEPVVIARKGTTNMEAVRHSFVMDVFRWLRDARFTKVGLVLYKDLIKYAHLAPPTIAGAELSLMHRTIHFVPSE